MRASKRKYVIQALELIPKGEFTPEDVRLACRRDITISEISGNLRSIENVRYVRRGPSRSRTSVWEKLYRYLTRKVQGLRV